VIDCHTSFAHHLLKITVADTVATIPPQGPKDNLTLKMAPLEIRHFLLMSLRTG
jgi:hypothetical protein